MALAVAEAQRVLRPGGLLLDIHPRAAPLRLEVWRARGTALPGSRAPEGFDQQALGDLAPEEMAADFAASTRALEAAPGLGLALSKTVHFDYRFFFDTLDDLTTYLEDNDELALATDALLERALDALRQASRPAQLVLVQPVIATRLEKA
jgi:hypothetical protein